jgi:hypothetical protein
VVGGKSGVYASFANLQKRNVMRAHHLLLSPAALGAVGAITKSNFARLARKIEFAALLNPRRSLPIVGIL